MVFRYNFIFLIGFLACFAIVVRNRRRRNRTLFTDMNSDHTGITFANNLPFDKEFNIYTYRNYYNGGGVAIGDINNDGLLDVYLTGNIAPNKLYLNQGDFQI